MTTMISYRRRVTSRLGEGTVHQKPYASRLGIDQSFC